MGRVNPSIADKTFVGEVISRKIGHRSVNKGLLNSKSNIFSIVGPKELDWEVLS
jgi:hypothetical protein